MYQIYGFRITNAIWIGIGIAILLSIVAGWKLLEKAGEKPWKILIPFYGAYCLYKIAEASGVFWGMLVVNAAASIISNAVSNNIARNTFYLERPDVTPVRIIAIISVIITLIMQFYYAVKLAEAFGKGKGFAVGLFFLFPIFALILGFGSAVYGQRSGYKTTSSTVMWKCTRCGAENPQSRTTCQNCGVQKERMTASSTVMWKCTRCGAENPQSIATCQNCGVQKENTGKKKTGWAWLILIVIGAIVLFSVIQSSSTKTTRSSSENHSPIITNTATSKTTATQKPTATPEPTATPKPVNVYNGQIIRKPDYEGVANFTIKASSTSSHYVYLQYKGAPAKSTISRTLNSSAASPYEDDLAFYVEAGKEATVNVPIGLYKLYYASGNTYFGEKLLFGNRTSFYSSDDLMDFYADENYIYGHTVTLTAVVNGNLDTDPIPESQFPGRQ